MKIFATELKLKTVSSLSTDSTGGITPASGVSVDIMSIDIHGASPDCFVAVVWDYGGGAQKYFASTAGSFSRTYDRYDDTSMRVTGDGSKKLIILITNNSLSTSPVVGGKIAVRKT